MKKKRVENIIMRDEGVVHTHVMVRTSIEGRDGGGGWGGGEAAAVNEDIYDTDPEFRYLALSLTVKNRSGGGWAVGRRR